MHLTITATELYNGLANTLHFAGNEKRHPELNSIKISTHTDGAVVFTATCRHAVAQVLAEAILEPGDSLTAGSVVLPTAGVKKFMAFTKLHLTENLPMVILVDRLLMSLSEPGSGTRMVIETIPVDQYPDINILWPTAPVGLNAEPSICLLDPTIMGRLAKLRAYTLRPWAEGAHLQLGLGSSPSVPALVTYRDWFRAIIKPLGAHQSDSLHAGLDPRGRFPS